MSRGFRVWDNQTKNYDSDREFVLNLSGELMELCSNHNGTWEYRFADTDRFIVEFETGLKDKNGKEIYEGDIVYDIYTGDEVFIVGWDKNKASFMLADTADYPMAYFDEYELDKDLEVIGNVHENPELIGGEE